MDMIYCSALGVFDPYKFEDGNPLGFMYWGDYADNGDGRFYSPKMVDAFNDMISEHENVRCVWSAGWPSEVREFGENIGLSESAEWEVLPDVEEDDTAAYQRFESVKNHVEKYAPPTSVWIDPYIELNEDLLDWCADHNVLIVIPDPEYGLTAESIGDINLHLMPELIY